MPNNNYKNWESFISRTKIYLIIIALLMLVICIYDYRLIIPGILIYGIIIFYTIWSNKKRKAELSEQLKDLTLNVNTTAKTTLINSPFPLAIVETDGNLIWKSEKFVTEFEIPEVEINEYITEIVKGIKLTIENSDEIKPKGNIDTSIKINNKDYKILGSYVKSHKSHQKEQEYTTILYFIDETDNLKLQKEYNDSKAEADDKFKEAEQKIADAQEEIDAIADPEWYVFDRSDNPGYSTFAQNVERLGAVASVFPMFFLLVAVLVCVTTMSRLVEEKRKEIGILKALGYNNLSIIMKFAIYAVFAGVIGCTVGVLIGINTLPYIIYNAYQIMYYMPDISIVPDAQSIILGTLAAVLCTLLVSVIVCVRELSQSCAKILRPKTPKAGKRILLERITPIWKHMNFSAKLTTRNIFRYKSRMFMTIIGIAGCTALIVAAFGLKNSFIPLTDTQFSEIFKYNTVVIPKEGGTAEQLDYLKNAINNTGDAASIMLAGQQEVVVKKNNVVKDESTYLTVMEDPQRFSEVTELRTRGDKKHLDITDDSVMINEKMATELSAKVGDTVSVTVDDKTAELTVGGIYEQYIKNYVFISPKLYSEKFGEEPQFNMAQVVLKNPDEQTAFGEKMLTNDKVAGVTYLSSGMGEIEDMLNSLNMVVLVMIICAAALAFVVLYNLTNINIAERVREIATFKVLGFYSRETSSVIYKENIVLTLGGILSGLVLGILLTRFIIQTVEVDNVMFGRDILPTSFVFAALLTFAFALIVNFAMGFKIKKVNMVESLKSVE